MTRNFAGSVKIEFLKDFIKRMLVYYDPMDLIILGAPHDEYDNDIDEIMKLAMKYSITVGELSVSILNLYRKDASDLVSLKRKSERMAEDLIYMKKS